MGTSTAYGGPGGGTPLVPSWLGGEDAGTSPAAPAGPDGSPPADGVAPPAPANRPPIPTTADPQRFSGARNSFSRFAGSGGSDRASLGRAVSRYVSTSAGGARQAAQRMGASRGRVRGSSAFWPTLRRVAFARLCVPLTWNPWLGARSTRS